MDVRKCPSTAVIGADGYLGRAFFDVLRTGDTCPFATSHRRGTALAHYDLGEACATRLPLQENGVEAAIIAAGISGGACGEHPGEARAVNVDGTLTLIRELWGQNVLPVSLSSDNVFDGLLATGGYADEGAVAPTTEYGRQKSEVERFLADSGRPFLAVRLSKVFSLERGDGTLLDEMAQSLMAGHAVRAAFDQVFCPTLREDVVRAVLELLAAGVRGLINVCSPEPLSRYALALQVAARLQCDSSLVERVSLDSIFPGERRPKRTVMKCRRLQEELQFNFTPMAGCIDTVAGNYLRR